MEIKYKPLSYLFDYFDFLIRFCYCRLGLISKLAHRLMFWKLYSSNLDVLKERFDQMKVILLANSVSLTNKEVLELGPGNSYLNGCCLLLEGVRRVILIDKFSRHFKNKKQREFFNKEIVYLRKMYPGKGLFFLDDKSDIKKEFIWYLNGDLINIDHNKVDFIYSFSVLEHIRDIQKNIQVMSSLLKSGGYMYHYIDLRDHYNFNNPFLFYKYSDRAWSLLTKEGLSYTNRWRYEDFKKEFLKNNLSIIREETATFQLPRKINPIFTNNKLLNIGILKILLRKF